MLKQSALSVACEPSGSAIHTKNTDDDNDHNCNASKTHMLRYT